MVSEVPGSSSKGLKPQRPFNSLSVMLFMTMQSGEKYTDVKAQFWGFFILLHQEWSCSSRKGNGNKRDWRMSLYGSTQHHSRRQSTAKRSLFIPTQRNTIRGILATCVYLFLNRKNSTSSRKVVPEGTSYGRWVSVSLEFQFQILTLYLFTQEAF